MHYDQVYAMSLNIIYKEAINDLIKGMFMDINFLDPEQNFFELKTAEY